jgi:hypothetical protein
MDKSYKNRSGSQSNASGKTENTNDRKRESLPGSPGKSNRQTKGRNENGSERDRDEKKGPNSI